MVFVRRALWIVLVLWASGMALSGLMLVLFEPIDSAINRLVIPSFPIEERKASFEQLVRAVRERFPAGEINLKPSRGVGELAIAEVYFQNQGHVVLLNPHNASMLQVRHRRGTLLDVVEHFHRNLFLNGFFWVMAICGIVIWWGAWMRICLLLCIILFAGTGWFSPVSRRPNLHVDAPVFASPHPMDDLVAAAERALPGIPIDSIQVSSDPNRPVYVIKGESVAVNPYTAQVIEVQHLPVNRIAVLHTAFLTWRNR